MNPRFEKIIPTPPPVHEIVRDNSTGLEWQAAPFDKRMSWADAEKACKALRLGGHDDWRMPSLQELESIRDLSRVNPAIDTDAFPNTPNEWFWTSTPCADSPKDTAWVVSFGNGGSDILNRGYSYRVRAVRGPARQ